MKKIIIVGGGAAGMFAAVSAANEHTEVHIYEHNEKLGKKLFITGKGRCKCTIFIFCILYIQQSGYDAVPD